MKILFVHNFYQQHGGEEKSFAQEVALLRGRGHTVIEYTRTNAEAASYGRGEKLRLPAQMIWSQETYQAVSDLLRRERPDIVHVNNLHFIISPSIFHACAHVGIPVVTTLRSYRLVCPGSRLMRDGHVCEDCVGKVIAWPGVVHGCWRESRAQTAVIAAMLAYHRLRGTWTETITRYIALTEFSRQKFIEGGLPAKKIVVRPNFLDPDPGSGTHDGKFVLFAGRLSEEKGLDILLDAYALLQRDGTQMPLKIVGDGPMMEALQQRVVQMQAHQISFEGWQTSEVILDLMRRATLFVAPSTWYEGLPRVLIEAFACGTPAITSDLGSMSEMIVDGESGLLVEQGNAAALAERMAWAWRNPERIAAIGQQARAVFERKYTAEANYASLIRIYEDAIQSVRSG
jgi:glycosyltransferase involved in cell wall biosynthesis